MKVKNIFILTLALTFAYCVAQNSSTSLLEAANNGNIEEVRKLLQAGANPNKADYFGDTPLIRAAYRGHLAVVQALLQAGADKNKVDYSGSTPLIRAAMGGHLGVVHALLKAGADPNKKNLQGQTAFDLAPTAIKKLIQEVQKKRAQATQMEPRVLEPEPLRRGFTGRVEPKPLYLLEAASEGNLEEVRKLLLAGADLNQVDKYGNTPLIRAAMGGHLGVVHALLKAGADINQGGQYGYTPLMWAAGAGFGIRLGILQELLKAGADINKANDYGTTPLMWAATHGNLGAVQELLQAGADINKANEYGMTPLIDAADQGHLAVVKALLEVGADINKADKDGSTSLMRAADQGHLGIVQALLQAGADPNKKNLQGQTAFDLATPEIKQLIQEVQKKRAPIPHQMEPRVSSAQEPLGFGSTGRAEPKPLSLLEMSLLEAAIKGNLEEVRKFLQAGADVNIVDYYGFTPLGRAADWGHLAVVQALLQAGADPNKAESSGFGATPLMSGLSFGETGETRQGVVQALLQAGADPNKADNRGFTPLRHAVDKRNLGEVQELLQAGADPNKADNRGFTPLMQAVNKVRLRIVQELLQAGADPNKKNLQGFTAFDLAPPAIKPLIQEVQKKRAQATQMQPSVRPVLVPLGRGFSFGRRSPDNIEEERAMKEIMSNPVMGGKIPVPMTDPRWDQKDGWFKMEWIKNVLINNKPARVRIHYVGQWKNDRLVAVDDFKFKD